MVIRPSLIVQVQDFGFWNYCGFLLLSAYTFPHPFVLREKELEGSTASKWFSHLPNSDAQGRTAMMTSPSSANNPTLELSSFHSQVGCLTVLLCQTLSLSNTLSKF